MKGVSKAPLFIRPLKFHYHEYFLYFPFLCSWKWNFCPHLDSLFSPFFLGGGGGGLWTFFCILLIWSYFMPFIKMSSIVQLDYYTCSTWTLLLDKWNSETLDLSQANLCLKILLRLGFRVSWWKLTRKMTFYPSQVYFDW